MSKSFPVPSVAHWPAAWAWLAPQLSGRRVLALEGELGAGKTTFVKTVAAALGATDPVTSPTFTLVQEYPTPAGPLYHFDLYRLESTEEVLQLGFEEYLDGARLAVVEWPQIAAPLLSAEETLWVKIATGAGSAGRLLLL